MTVCQGAAKELNNKKESRVYPVEMGPGHRTGGDKSRDGKYLLTAIAITDIPGFESPCIIKRFDCGEILLECCNLFPECNPVDDTDEE